jgi:rhamnopyranosyl-N-acetylglucosaminyl-diphospho-decaprenol beta-1,3/1,4-galactofuranosyltransferase
MARKSNEHEKVCAVVVTYNRKDMLIECLQGLVKQSHALDAIYIIDNQSTDETTETLIEEGFVNPTGGEIDGDEITSVQKNNIKIVYVRLDKNTGGAGGFYEGVRRASAKGFDWLWLMDDDVIPDPDCLKSLLDESFDSECIQPSRYFNDNTPYLWHSSFEPITGIRYGIDAFEKGGKLSTFVGLGCFEGMLIQTNIVQKIGLPSRDYFIAEDDTLYGFKASLHTNVKYTRRAKMKKLIVPVKKIAPWKTYYQVRNRIWLFKDISNILNLREKDYFSALRVLMFFFWLGISLRIVLSGVQYIIPSFRGLMDGLRYKSSENRFLEKSS